MDALNELIKIFNHQNDLVKSLASGENTLVGKNIINPAKDDPPNLKNNEKKRVQESSSIFVKTYFDELKKREKDTKLETKTSTSSTGKLASGISKDVQDKVGEKSKGLFDKIKTGLLAAIPFLGAILKKISPLLKGLGTFIGKIFSKLGSLVKGLFGKISSAITKVWSAIKNSKAYKALKGLFSRAISGVKNVFSKIVSKFGTFFKTISSKLGSLVGKIRNSNAFKMMGKAFESTKKAIASIFNNIKGKIVKTIGNVVDKAKSLVPDVVKKTAAPAKSFLGKALSVGKNILSSGAEIVGKGVSSGAKIVGKGVSAVAQGATALGKGAASMTASAAKKTVSIAAKGAIKSAGGMLGLLGKIAGKGLSKIPIIGPAIESAMAMYDIASMKDKLAKGEITVDQLQKDAGKRVISGVTGMLGSASGAVLAGTLGSIIPGAGTALGAIAGGILGDTAGRFLGGLVTDYIIPEKYTKTIGAFVTKTTPPKEEMQDFIIKDGQLHKFSQKDEIMGLKSGGAINEFLRGNGNNSIMNKVVSIGVTSNNYLKLIANNTAIMAKNMNNGGSAISPPTMVVTPPLPTNSKQMISIPDNRDGYFNSVYSLG